MPAEGGHGAQLAHKDFFAAHDEVGPRIFGGDFALVEQLKAFGVGFDQQQNAAFIEGENAVALRDEARVFAERVGVPHPRAGLQVDAGEALVAHVQVGVAVDDDRRRHVALGVVAPGLLHVEGVCVACGFPDRVEPAAVLITAREDGVANDGGRQDVHPAIRRHGVRPHDLSGYRIDAGEIFPRLHDELSLAVNRREHGRRKCTGGHDAGFALEGAPDDFTGVLPEFDEGVGGLDEDRVAIQERGADEAEVRHAGAVFFDEIDGPLFFAGERVNGDEDVAHTGHEDEFSVGGGGGANPVTAGFGVERHGQRAGP